MDNNKIKVTATNVNLPELCAALFNEIQALYPKIKSELVINLKDSLYKVDEVLMRNILGNLISNAFQYNTEYGHVVLNVNLVSNSIVYHIVDTGIGIPLEEQINLFIPFTRMSNSLHTRGTGLGLSIIKGSVKKLGGAISFESKENAGSSFTVFIPIM
jgi:K+-sensing histidine kinase KdpD